MPQRAADEMLGALPDHLGDGSLVQGNWLRSRRGQVQITQHQTQCHRKVAQRIDHGAVKVHQRGLNGGKTIAQGLQNFQAICWAVAAITDGMTASGAAVCEEVKASSR